MVLSQFRTGSAVVSFSRDAGSQDLLYSFMLKGLHFTYALKHDTNSLPLHHRRSIRRQPVPMGHAQSRWMGRRRFRVCPTTLSPRPLTDFPFSWLFVVNFGYSKPLLFSHTFLFPPLYHPKPLTSSRLGSLRLGNNLRSMAPLQPRVRYRAGGLLELDVQLHRRPNHAHHARENRLRDFHLLWADDRGGVCVHMGICPRNEALDFGGDGCAVWEFGGRGGGMLPLSPKKIRLQNIKS